MSANDDNPRLQCERCGKWRRLITAGEQCMYPYSADMDGFKGDREYSCLCVWCQREIEAIPAPTNTAEVCPECQHERLRHMNHEHCGSLGYELICDCKNPFHGTGLKPGGEV